MQKRRYWVTVTKSKSKLCSVFAYNKSHAQELALGRKDLIDWRACPMHVEATAELQAYRQDWSMYRGKQIDIYCDESLIEEDSFDDLDSAPCCYYWVIDSMNKSSLQNNVTYGASYTAMCAAREFIDNNQKETKDV